VFYFWLWLRHLTFYVLVEAKRRARHAENPAQAERVNINTITAIKPALIKAAGFGSMGVRL
jgi:hypothetical protein